MKVPVISASATNIRHLAVGGSCKMVPKETLIIVVRGMILAKAIPTAITAIDATHNQDIKSFVPNGRASPRYVQLCFQHQERALLREVNTATHGTKKLDTATIEGIAIPLPDRATQKSLVESISRLDEASVRYGMEHIRLKQIRLGLSADLLSGRVRVPQSNVVPIRSNVQPAFKRAVFAAEIVQQLHNDNKFGSVKHEKIVHLCELHIGLHDALDRHAYKEAAGPYDPKARRSVESIFAKQKWFKAHKPDGIRVVYAPLEKCGGHEPYYDRYFGTHKTEIQQIIDLLRPLDTERCEIIATLYAVWNDFLIDGKQPTDQEIVTSVMTDWHPKKKQIAEGRWLRALPWMRQQQLIPSGKGEKTRVKAT